MKYAEFKIIVDTNKDNESGTTSWQDVHPILRHKCRTENQANSLARSLANTNNRECRWNWLNSSQGHYIMPTPNNYSALLKNSVKFQLKKLVY